MNTLLISFLFDIAKSEIMFLHNMASQIIRLGMNVKKMREQTYGL